MDILKVSLLEGKISPIDFLTNYFLVIFDIDMIVLLVIKHEIANDLELKQHQFC